jgi:hypothetical protein
MQHDLHCIPEILTPAKPARQSSFILYFLSTYSLLSRLSPVLNITMSFGFGVGDFVAVLQLANTVHERFVGAPDQFKAISNE